MKTSNLLGAFAALSLFAFGAVSDAAPRKLIVGVYLPGTIADGAGRFAFAEAFAESLGAATQREGVARNFGRYEDFQKAVSSGLLEVIIVDGYVVAQSGLKYTPLGTAIRSQDQGGRWAIISRNKVSSMKGLQGKRLAVLKAAKGGEAKFVANTIFMGDYDVQKNFRIVPVPDVESALKSLEAKSVEAALVPLTSVPAGANVVFRSSKLPSAVVGAVRGDTDSVGEALLTLGKIAPFEKFIPPAREEIAAFSQLVARGPAKRTCVMADSPTVRVDANALIRFNEVGKVMPAFTDYIAAPTETPDD